MEEYDEEMFEYCYECGGLGYDYYLDDDGELICAFTECMFNPYRNDED